MSVAIRTEFLQIPEDLMTLPSASAKKKKKKNTPPIFITDKQG